MRRIIYSKYIKIVITIKHWGPWVKYIKLKILVNNNNKKKIINIYMIKLNFWSSITIYLVIKNVYFLWTISI